MSALWVKICGLTTAQAVDAAVEAGVDAIGFVFHAASPRNIAPAEAARLAARVPSHIETVAVTRHPSPELLQSLFGGFRPRLLQTDLADFAGIVLPVGVEALPVLRTGAVLPEPLPQRCLYEGAQSGQGHRADWAEAARLAGQTRLVLAGGLDPDSVTQAVLDTRPYGVDVSSGVESAPGCKDSRKMAAFVAAARAAAAQPKA